MIKTIPITYEFAEEQGVSDRVYNAWCRVSPCSDQGKKGVHQDWRNKTISLMLPEVEWIMIRDLHGLNSVLNEFTQDITNVTEKDWLQSALAAHFRSWFNRTHPNSHMDESQAIRFVNNWWQFSKTITKGEK